MKGRTFDQLPTFPPDLAGPWNNCKGRKPYRWNVYPAAREDHRLVRRLRPTWSRARFLAERDAAIATCRDLARIGGNAWNEARDKFGEGGTYYGSRGWDSWPADVRSRVGDLAVLRCHWWDLALAYHLCAGKRKGTLPSPY